MKSKTWRNPALTGAGKNCIIHYGGFAAWLPNRRNQFLKGGYVDMKRIKTIETRDLAKSAVSGGCGECQTSCQSACKTSCGVANQACEHKQDEK